MKTWLYFYGGRCWVCTVGTDGDTILFAQRIDNKSDLGEQTATLPASFVSWLGLSNCKYVLLSDIIKEIDY